MKRLPSFFTLLILVLILVFNFTACRTSAQNESEKVLKILRHGIESEMGALEKDMASAARSLSGMDMAGSQARAILDSLLQKRPYAVDSCTISRYGKIIALQPAAYSEFEGSDISSQEQVIRLFITMKPALSLNFRAVEGFEAADFEYPVFSSDNKITGTLSVMINPKILVDNVLAKNNIDKTSGIMLMQPDGRIIYETDASQIGRNTFLDPLYEPYPQLLELARKVSAKPSGIGKYTFLNPDSGKNTGKEAIWDTFSFHGAQWRIVIISTEAS